MSLVLGIDTGGTYTDGAVIDRRNRKVLVKAKSLTTKDDLSRGIISCINSLEFERLADISLVSLSTTLATNAIVEGHGCEVGLLMIGFTPEQEIPVRQIQVVPGGHNVKGIEKEAFDEQQTREALEALRGSVDAVAVSGYLSIRNPEHELHAQALIDEVLGVPVVCAHHLSRSLGIHERTVTAALNAKLLPIVKDLLDAVRAALHAMGILVPIMVVRGDGTLVGEDSAKQKPIETLLSGPAASIIGATFLSGLNDAMVLDMGGTTTDVALIRGGIPRIDERGARVGGYLTQIEAAAINTYGLGGDSYIQMDMARKLKIGPQRVMPISMAASEHPHLVDELRGINIPYAYLLRFVQVVDCFYLLNAGSTSVLTETDKKIIETLQNEPHSIFTIAQRIDTDVNLLNLERLINVDVLGRISVTPTDLLHANGSLKIWDSEAALLAVSKLAARFGLSSDEFVDFASEAVIDELSYACVQSLINHENGGFDIKSSSAASYFFEKQIHPREDCYLSCCMAPTIPLVGIGAPVKAWLPAAAKVINSELFIPENEEVANAIGSAVGKVIESVKILITPGDGNNGFNVHSAWEMRWFKTLEEAAEYSTVFAKERAEEAARNSGATSIEVTLNYRDLRAKSATGDEDVYIESHVEAIATERPEWERGTRKERVFIDTANRGMTLLD